MSRLQCSRFPLHSRVLACKTTTGGLPQLRRVRRTATESLAIALGAALHCVAPQALAQSVATHTIHIPAESLSKSLDELALQTKTTIRYNPAQTNALRAPSIDGALATADALNLLLAGSGLVAQANASGAYLIESEAGEKTAKKPVELSGINVTAASADKVTSGALGSRSVLNTPFSISTVTAEDIENRQAFTLRDVFAGDAGVTSGGGSAYNYWASLISVRGLELDGYNAVKLNGLPLSAWGVNLPLEDLDQVQLLKGATAFMYGFSTPGGIVNYVTKKPTDEPTMSLDVGYRSDGIFSEHADWGGRFGDDGRFGYRANLSHEEGDTYYADGTIYRTAAVLSFDAAITPDLIWTADLFYQDSTTHNPPPYIKINQGTYFLDKLPQAPDAGINLASNSTFLHSKFYLVTSGLNWQIAPDWKASLNVSKGDTKQSSAIDFDWLKNSQGDLLDYYNGGMSDWKADFVQALLEGHFSTGPVAHQLAVGASWQTLTQVNGMDAASYVLLGTSNAYAPTRFTAYEFNGNNAPTYESSYIRQRSLLASDTMQFWKDWSFLLGLRSTDYYQASWSPASLTSSGWSVVAKAPYEKEPLTPTVALMYKPISGATLYASYVEALEQGATVGLVYANGRELLPPLTSKQYEVGFKLQQPSWDATAALFRLDRGAAYVNASNYYVQDGSVLFQGLEMAGDVYATQNLKFGASLLYLDDASYERTGVAWLIGRRIEGAPRFTAALQSSYDIPAISGLTLQADAKYYGPSVAQNITSTKVSVEGAGYTVFNAGLVYRTDVTGHPVTFRGEIQNLFDRRYWQVTSAFLAAGPSRVLSLNVKVDL